MNGILKRGKTLRERILNIYVYEIHYSKNQLIKSMHKIITSLFLQKSLEAYRNSGIQPKSSNASKSFLKECIIMVSFVKTGA